MRSPALRRALLLAALLLPGTLLRAQNGASPDALFVLPPLVTHVDVPFTPVGALVLVPARIEGGPERWYLLDTGAGVNVLDRAVADSLGLFGGALPRTDGGPAPAVMITDLTIEVGGVGATRQRVYVVPLGPLSAQIGHPVAGILGYDLLRLFATTFDYAARTVRFEAPAAFAPPPGALVLPMEILEGRPLVDAWVGRPDARPATGRFLLATGYDGAVSLNTPFVDAHSILRGAGPSGSAGPAVVGRLEGFGIGPLRFSAPVATLSRATSGPSAGTATAGVLGGDLFGRLRMTLDYTSGQFVAACTEACTAPFEADMSGLALLADPEGFRVGSAPRGTAGAEAGLVPGDLITHVDGRAAAEVGLMATRRLFRTDGATRTLTVRRDGQTRTVTLRLRRLV